MKFTKIITYIPFHLLVLTCCAVCVKRLHILPFRCSFDIRLHNSLTAATSLLTKPARLKHISLILFETQQKPNYCFKKKKR